MLVGRRHGSIAGLPIDRPGRDVHGVGRRVGQRDRAHVCGDDRGDPRTRLGHPLEKQFEIVGMGAAGPQLPVRQFVDRRCDLDRDWTGRARIEVDAGAERRKRLPHRRELLRIRHERGDHGRMIPAMPAQSADERSERSPTLSGFARPEMLASTEWLADHIGRPEIRVLDVRWRPDGSGRAAYASGHIPGAVHLDWRADLIDPSDTGDALLLAGPEQVATALAQAGVTDGTTVVIYDDTVGLFAARTWWSLRAYGFESARVLDGGYPAWVDEGRPISNAVVSPTVGRFTPRAQPRLRLMTADVRALLGSPDVCADRRAGAGRVPRLRGQHEEPRPHPRRRQCAGRGDDAARQPALPSRLGAARACSSRRTSHVDGGWSATTAQVSRPRSWPSP